MIIRWSIATGGLIALFWAIWYLIAGEVPTVTGIKMTEDWTYLLPFGISRWWDILIGPIWSTALILLFVDEKRKGRELDIRLVFGRDIGLVFGLVVGGLVFGQDIGLVFGLVVGLIFGLIIGLALEPDAGLDVLLIFELTFGLGFGLAVGSTVGVVAGLVIELIIGLTVLLRMLSSFNFRTMVWEWLVVK